MVAAALAIALAQAAGGRLNNDFTLPGSPSQRAQELLARDLPAHRGDTAYVVLRSLTPLDSGANRRTVARLVRAVGSLDRVTGVQGPFAPAAPQLSADGRTGFVVVQFNALADTLPAGAVKALIATAKRFSHPGLTVALGGAPIEQVVSAAPGFVEAVGVAAAVVVMLLAFGSLAAMALPIVSAILGVGLGFGILVGLSHLIAVPTFAPEVMGMIGLGVGIDYALFVVTRYRESLAAGLPPREATVRALQTAGRAVLLAGSMVVIALSGLFVVGLGFMDGLALATIIAVALVLTAALTLLPAFFGFLGRSIDRFTVLNRRGRTGPGGGERGIWGSWARMVRARPAAFAAGGVAVLALLAVPLLSMRLAFSDAGNDPPSLTTRQAYDLLAKGFGAGFNGPLLIAAELHGPEAQATVLRLATALRATPGVASVAAPQFNRSASAAMLVAYPTTAPQSAQTASLVRRLRERVIPRGTAGGGVAAYVGGETAAGVDTSAYLSNRLPLVIAAVVLLAFVLMMAVFRSLLVAAEAALMNLLVTGACYGVIVAVYQWGVAERLLGASAAGPIDPWIPLMIFTIAFGLSMDYEVFLLSRIRESWLRSGDNAGAIGHGLRESGRVITAAAAIMVCVFGSFVIDDPLRVLDVFGFGLAVAVLLDATIARMAIVPAVMHLLGPANWWLPSWLARRLPALDPGGTPETPALAQVQPLPRV